MGVKQIIYVDTRGRITLPAEFKKALKLKNGDKIWMEIIDEKHAVVGRVAVKEEIID